MCTKYDCFATKNFWKSRCRKNKTWIWCYKFFDIEKVWGKLLVQSYYCQSSSGYVIKPGWNISNRLDKLIMRSEMNSVVINKGMHVCTNSNILSHWLEFDKWRKYVVRIKCFKKDFVATDGNGQAVFMKYFLPKSEFDPILSKKMKRIAKK